MDEQIKVWWMPKAKAMEFIFKPMLERSYEMFQKNNRKDVVSEYVGGKFLVVNTVTPDGQVTQIALCRGTAIRTVNETEIGQDDAGTSA
jgi:hypothetical protein